MRLKLSKYRLIFRKESWQVNGSYVIQQRGLLWLWYDKEGYAIYPNYNILSKALLDLAKYRAGTKGNTDFQIIA